jgi:hypothetical protein
MRRLLVVAIVVAAVPGAGIALADQAATDPQGRFIDLSVSVSPPVAGTAKAPRGVGISFDSFTGNRINGDLPDNNDGITVRLSRGFQENGLLFPACQINPTAVTVCAKKTQVGSGTAEAVVAGSHGAAPTFLPATLVVYNGKPVSGKNPTAIIIASIGGQPVSEFDFGVTQTVTGPYGLALTELTPSGSSGFGITELNLNIPDRAVIRRVHGRKVAVHLLVAPSTCNGSWKFAQTNTFTDAPPLTATASQSCTTR